LAIHPFKSECVTGGGYDLSIGYWIVGEYDETISRVRIISQGSSDNEESEIEIPSFGYLAVIAKEYVYLGDQYVGTVHAKAGLASRGLFLNSTTVDPKWSGRMTFHLRNISNRPMRVSSHTSFATMLLHEIRPSYSDHPLFPQDALTRVVQDWEGEKSNAERYLRCESENEALQQTLKDRKSKFEIMSFGVLERHTISPLSLFRLAWAVSREERGLVRREPLSWIWISVLIAALACALYFGISFLSAEYRLWAGGGVVVFFTVLLAALWLNPATIYIRLLSGWILFGGAALTFGGAFELYSDSIPYLSALSWTSEPSISAQLVWLTVTGLLVWADLRSRVISRNV